MLEQLLIESKSLKDAKYQINGNKTWKFRIILDYESLIIHTTNLTVIEGAESNNRFDIRQECARYNKVMHCQNIHFKFNADIMFNKSCFYAL